MVGSCEVDLWSQQRGRGRPVLLIHGLGASAHYWDRVMREGPPGRLVAPDLVGFGRSPAPADIAYDVACHVRALEPMVEAGTLVVGHSTGAVIAAALAAAYPEQVRGLLLVSLPAFPDAETARSSIAGLGLLARLTVEGRPSGRRLCQAMCRMRSLALVLAPLVVRDLPPAVAADGVRHTWTSYSRTLEEVLVHHPVVEDLTRVQVPVRLLHGREDRTAPLHLVEQMVAGLVGSRARPTLAVVDDGHHLPIHRSGAVAEAIAAAG